MAKDTATIEKPDANTPHPSERLFAADHPELVVEKPVDKAVKKSAFEDGLDAAIETVVKPKEKPKEESQEEVKPSETEEKPSEETPSKEKDKPSETSTDNVESADKVKDYAEKNGLTEAEAKAEIDEYEAIAKKYDNDPIKIAKAYKNMQSTMDKQKATETTNQQAKLAQEIMSQGAEAFVAKAEKENAAKWVEEYRRVYPNESEQLTDAVIIERCRQQAIGQVKSQMAEYQSTLKSNATTKREELIKSLSVEDRAHVSEISRVLKGLPDIQVVEPNFAFKDLVDWARGNPKNIERIKKEAYERGFKAAKAGEIVGEIVSKPTGQSKPRIKENKPSGDQLTPFQKKQAIQQYASIDGTDEDRYAAYLDVLNSRKK